MLLNQNLMSATTSSTTLANDNANSVPSTTMRTLFVKTMMPNANVNSINTNSTAQMRTFQPIQTVLPTTTTITTATVSTTIMKSSTITTPPILATTTTSTATQRVSPTFIEHKYSANTFKEKFLANLRSNNRNTMQNRIIENDTVVTDKVAVTPVKNANALNRSGLVTGGIGELCAIQQQLNENCKNTFHKKTII